MTASAEGGGSLGKFSGGVHCTGDCPPLPSCVCVLESLDPCPPSLHQASGLRLLSGSDLGKAGVVAAVSGSRGIPDKTKLLLDPAVTTFHMPRYSMVSAAGGGERCCSTFAPPLA
jgi:hypothetical protein